jgi:hypothetical protein
MKVDKHPQRNVASPKWSNKVMQVVQELRTEACVATTAEDPSEPFTTGSYSVGQ